ncbi:hypothetical protein GQ600_19348 [Phytophthora cactorum]|nr:hypothetical protein GQ600_19348 [Phytophthora cactorum]
MKDLPSQGAVVDTVAALHDSNASSCKISGYISEKFGNPVATTPTGRGYHVLDFMSLNEKAVTLEKIFGFFKSKNTSWMKIRTFVIDKHVVEWRCWKSVSLAPRYCSPSSTQLCIGRNWWELGSAWWLRTKTQFNTTLQRCCIGITDVIELQHRYWRNSEYILPIY